MSRNREFAEDLSDVMRRMDDLKIEAAAILEAAKDSGVNVKALRKIAKEMIMDRSKLEQRFDDEGQLELFRAEVGLKVCNGLVMEAA